MTAPTQTGPRLTPTSVAGVWHTHDHRFMCGPLPGLRAWALDYWPVGMYSYGHTGPIHLTTADLDHTQHVIDLICWAETEGARRG